MLKVLSTLLWLAVWGGYNSTDAQHLFFGNSYVINPQLFSNLVTTFHWVRGLLPALAGIPALFLLRKRSLLSPLGLMAGYSVISGLAEFTNKEVIPMYVWGAILFSSVIFVLLAIVKNPLSINSVFKANWLIAGFIALGMMGFLLLQPGAIHQMSITSLLDHGIRPFEGWGGSASYTPFMGMVGSRPTGMGRYAAVAALASLCALLNARRMRWICLVLFPFFTYILLFSKGRTEILAFVISAVFVFFLSKKWSSPLVLVLTFVIGISLFSVFGRLIPDFSVPPPQVTVTQEVSPLKDIFTGEASHLFPEETQVLRKFATLSGRTGVWNQALGFIKDKWLVGYGVGTSRHLLRAWNGLPAGVDNTLLHALMQSGVSGTLLFLLSLFSAGGIAFNVFKNKKPFLLEGAAIAIFFLLRGLTQSFAGYGADWMFLAPIIAYLQTLRS